MIFSRNRWNSSQGTPGKIFQKNIRSCFKRIHGDISEQIHENISKGISRDICEENSVEVFEEPFDALQEKFMKEFVYNSFVF